MSIWDWTAQSERPLCGIELKREHSNQHHLRFNPRQSSQLVSNSSTQVLFYEWSHSEGIICFDPELNERVNPSQTQNENPLLFLDIQYTS